MATITIISPEAPPRTVELATKNTLGRHPDNSIQLLDRIVSKNHCHIDRVESGFVLRDLGSLNGTHINGVRMSGNHNLNSGDEVTLGSTKLLYQADAAAGAEAPAAQPASEGVEKGARDSAAQLSKVTMMPGMVESHVRAKLSQEGDQKFMPERLVQDNAVLRADYEKLRVSFELTKAIGGELDVDKMLEKILGTAFDLIGADRGVVLLLNDGDELEARCVHTKKGKKDEEVALSQTIINQVLKERTAMLSSDALTDSRFTGAKSIIMQGIRSSMAVPLIHSDELLGVMVLDSQVATAFKDKDLQLTQVLANQAAIGIQNGMYAEKLEKEAVTRERFQRLLSPAIAELVINGDVEVEKGGHRRETTVFFSDIRGFTAMSEKATAEEIVTMLNEYFEMMVEVIFEYEGTLDKFVGDEIMALFGSPVSHDDDAYRAVKVAVRQMLDLAAWNQQRVTDGKRPVEIGIGINSGEVVAGYLGSSKALEYTVIGDVVNTAARLCSAATAGQVIISRETYDRVKEYFEVEELPPTHVKGKAQALQIYRVIGEAPGVTPPPT